MNGKVHHIKYPYKARIEDSTAKYLEQLRQATSKFETNNCIIGLRNDMYDLFDELFQRLYIELKYKVIIMPSRRDWTTIEAPPQPKSPCIICGEHRIIRRCRIIPSEIGGSNQENNAIYLCPTHRYLWEHHTLNKSELDRIAGKINDKAADSIEYFQKFYMGGHP